MGRLEDQNKRRRVEAWRIRTGNMTYKGTHRDTKTQAAEKIMARKPYERIT